MVSTQAELPPAADALHPGKNEPVDANPLGRAAQELAKTQGEVQTAPGKKLVFLRHPQLQESLLQQVYQHFALAAQTELTVSYGGEWMLDNFYLVQQGLRQIHEDMPAAFYNELPKLVDTPLADYPRIYAIARAIIRLSHHHLTLEPVRSFLVAYQQVTPLTMGELWALPAMMRVVTLENLTRVTSQMIGLPVAHALAPAPDEILLQELSNDTLIANCIMSLRMLATQDWGTYFEDVSRVEQILRQDPADAYAKMDFDSRNRYRKVIEELAPHTGHDEEHVALAAISLAENALAASRNGDSPMPDSNPNRAGHIGFYLIDRGRSQLETRIGYRPTAGVRGRRYLLENAFSYYLGAIAVLTLAILLLIARYGAASRASPGQLLALGLFALLPASAMAVQVINWLISRIIPPRTLPKMDFSEGIPARFRTMVVIPALLTRAEEVDDLAQEMELHYLRNEDEHLHIALLADFGDAPQQYMPGDAALMERATKRIQTLNDKYSRERSDPFYFFMRERRWNPSEEAWMGWERKRGKLMELNRLVLHSANDTSYIVQFGDLSILPGIRFIITLDSDTILPRDGARELVGMLAHPLNQPVLDANDHVVAGYTILQPRVAITPTSANATEFARISAGDSGLDLYTLAVSDVYQDLFGEGSYIGKGIYDVAAFERTVADRIPENSLLSHDLFEGAHGRAALVTDVVLLEDYPPHYLAYAQRLHRWVRGDWQLLPWLLPSVPFGERGTIPNTLSWLARWKIVDNLRRSLTTPALFVLLIAGWLWLPGSSLAWTLIGLGLSAFSFAIPVFNDLFGLIRGNARPLRFQPSRAALLRWLLSVAFLPFEAVLTLDAILTTLVRLVRRKNLLRWTTAAHTLRLLGEEGASGVVWRRMLPALVLTIILGIVVILGNPSALLAAAPLLALWLISPQMVLVISRPIQHQPPGLSEEQQQELRRLARRTWLYFEKFVGPEEHWLPPDHYQESPRDIIAHHTSPTNIGLLLLSTIAAYDFGYMGLLELLLRMQFTFDSLDNLERHRGHFLNWYDTQTLKPLSPRYVSTVDSGNLAGCLLAVIQGHHDLLQTPIMRPERWQGLLDTLAVLGESLNELEPSAARGETTSLRTKLDAMVAQVKTVQHQPGRRAEYVTEVSQGVWQDFRQLLMTFVQSEGQGLNPAILNDLSIYSDRVQHHLSNMSRDVELLLPWHLLLNETPLLFSQPDTNPAILRDWQGLNDALPLVPRLGMVREIYAAGKAQVARLQQKLADRPQNDHINQANRWCQRLIEALESADSAARDLLAGFDALSQKAEKYLQEMNFSFLFDPQRCVFHIGYNVDVEQLDNSFYDLLASEARLASLIAIAKGEVPQSHWLHLGRPIKRIENTQALLSWSGTMFEYLMPLLLMRNYHDTLLDQSYRAVVHEQMAYANQQHVPWGISESGYYAFDGSLNYQYRAFGVPELALKRGLAADLVIAPYASLIALPVFPRAVLENLARLKKLKTLSTYGLYEAIDYTPNRLALGQRQVLIREYMIHHQGMILVTLANSLLDDVMIRRFHADPRIQSVELLLQEQIPVIAAPKEERPGDSSVAPPALRQKNVMPWSVQVDAPSPQVHLLSNGRYQVLLTSAGSGFSQWKSSALTRWRADTTLDEWGSWVYILDKDKGLLWSAGYQPTAIAPDSQTVLFHPNKAEFQRQNHDISLHMEVTVPPDDDLEIRRIRLTNHSDHVRHLMLTSYGEVVLAPQEADQRHPAFNKLFIESEYLAPVSALLFHRRPRADDEEPVYVIHMLVLAKASEQSTQREQSSRYETDRGPFLGRGKTPRAPAAVLEGVLSGTVGATLDPIMALGQEIDLQPYETIQMAYITAAGSSRQTVMALANTYQQWSSIERAFDQARYQGEYELSQLDLDTPQLERVQKLLAALLYPHSGLRAPASTLAANARGQSGLWAYGISGDDPILLVEIGDEGELGLLQELLQAHTFWRNRQIKITLVILNQHDTGYLQELYNQVHQLIVRSGSETWLNRHDGIFILRADQLDEASRILLETAARVYLHGENGTLAKQVASSRQSWVPLPPFTPFYSEAEIAEPTLPVSRPTTLLFDNGFGGFSPDGREYMIYLEPGKATPAPWINVIANPDFGFLVSETGSGFTWVGNSSEFRLTSWRNDPVSDLPSEVLYLRDEETAVVWSPTPQPVGASEPYLIRHGHGYSIFENHSHGLKQELRLSVAPEAPVKIIRLRLENTWSRVRRITVTYYAEMVLGTTREITQQYLIPEFETSGQTLLTHNPYSMEFGETYAFISSNRAFHGLTTDRAEFLGRMGTLGHPAALGRIGLAGTVQAGNDPCAAVQVHVDLPPGAVEEVFFVIGAGKNRQQALQLAEEYRNPEHSADESQKTVDFWKDVTSAITIKTPDPAMNILLPWLLYQTLSCRIWGRSALYQSSGAFGFRDQLQDVMALLYARPGLAREHILRAAGRQFEAGDVLHWWHPPSGRGVRTRFSDDLLWLPYVVAQYVEASDDVAILQEKIPFLKGEPLKAGEDECYGFFEATAETFTLYEHCRRALARGTTAGAHGLPLMGTGDWNDGLNRVGVKGRGESVWVGWFLYAVMARFVPLCERLGDQAEADAHRLRMSQIREALEANAWDGKWYLRAYDDKSRSLGSSGSQECRIDSIAQSWGVLSGAADANRARQAMESVVENLVKTGDQLVLLFTPPFDKASYDPGYIKGYPPGIRENGGQYTHAAIWTAWAFTEMGQGDRAEMLFRLLNPIHHSNTPEKAGVYRVEPYVVAADVYSVSPHVGRGGWTWYTGSSGWMYRLAVTAILGLSQEGKMLRMSPCIPSQWPGFELTYRYGKTTYHMVVENPDGVQTGIRQLLLDGQVILPDGISLVDDEREHKVEIWMGHQ